MHALVIAVLATMSIAVLCVGVLLALSRLGPRALGFVAPVLVVVGLVVVLPAAQTMWLTFFDGGSWAGSEHLSWFLEDPAVREAVRNTMVWVVVVAIGSTLAGFGFAALAERLRAQRLVTAVVMVPAVVSFVAVAVTWRLAYAFRPADTAQVGVINAVWGTSGLDPIAWIVQQPVNTFFLAMMLVWAQSGIAMLILSAAVARVPDSVRDAARIDGANEGQVFRRVTVPSIRGAIALAALTSAIVAIRVFDLVRVATDGQYGTNVLGTEMHDQAFLDGATGRGAVLAVVMLAAVVPLGWFLFVRTRRAGVVR